MTEIGDISGRGIKKVQLVNAPNNPGAGKASTQGCFPHLGLMNIGSLLKTKYPNIELEILDGTITSLEEILNKLNGDLIGISALTTTYESALKIAQNAKENGSIVVLGNDHASRFPRTILKNRPYIDAIFVGDHTELPFLDFISFVHKGKGNPTNIAGFWYRSDNLVTGNRPEVYSKEKLPITDRSLIDHKPYIENFNNLFENIHGYRASNTSLNFASGCIKKDKRCVYCDIYNLDLFSLSPNRVWEEILQLKENGFDWLWEVCDDFSSFAYRIRGQPSYIEKLVESKPTGTTPKLFVYSRARELTSKVVDLYKQLNIVKVNIGMESGDDLMLKSLDKGNLEGNKDNLKAAQLLNDAGIQIHVSYVLGAVGETKESLENTYQLAKELVRIGNVTSMDPSVLLPLPGAPVWRMLSNYDYARMEASKYGVDVKNLSQFESCLNTDLLETESLAKNWVDTFCKVNYEIIVDYAKKINCLIHVAGGVPGDFGVSNFNKNKSVLGDSRK